jgi:hypothetical protein
MRIKLNPEIDALINKLQKEAPNSVDGFVNYIFIRILDNVYEEQYVDLSRAMGVLSCVMHEFYRRKIAKHEDEAVIRNGEVFKDM